MRVYFVAILYSNMASGDSPDFPTFVPDGESYGTSSSAWSTFIRRFERALRLKVVSAGFHKEDDNKVNNFTDEARLLTFLQAVGCENEEYLESKGFKVEHGAPKDGHKYEDALNILKERYSAEEDTFVLGQRLFCARQMDGETEERFGIRVGKIADAFKDLDCDKLAVIAIVLGLRDTSLREHWCAKKYPTRENLMNALRVYGITKERKQTLNRGRVDSLTARVSAVFVGSDNGESRGRLFPVRSDFSRRSYSTGSEQPHKRVDVNQPHRRCWNCGRGCHTSRRCPHIRCYKCQMLGHVARDCTGRTYCIRCGRSGHLQGGCRDSRGRGPLGGEKRMPLNVIDNSMSNRLHKLFQKSLLVNRTSVTFTIDTGAVVTILTEETAECLKLELLTPTWVLVGPDGRRLHSIGEAEVSIRSEHSSVMARVAVVRHAPENLIGRTEIDHLQLIKIVGSTRLGSYDSGATSQRLLSLGRKQETCSIAQKMGTSPRRLVTPQSVPLGFREDGHEEQDYPGVPIRDPWVEPDKPGRHDKVMVGNPATHPKATLGKSGRYGTAELGKPDESPKALSGKSVRRETVESGKPDEHLKAEKRQSRAVISAEGVQTFHKGISRSESDGEEWVKGVAWRKDILRQQHQAEVMRFQARMRALEEEEPSSPAGRDAGPLRLYKSIDGRRSVHSDRK